MTQLHPSPPQPDVDLDDDFVFERPADCSDETWAEICRVVDERFKDLTAKAACPSWCVTEHDVSGRQNTFHRDQEVTVANYTIQLDLDPWPPSPEYADAWVCFDGTMLRPDVARELGESLIAAANRDDVSRATDEELIAEVELRISDAWQELERLEQAHGSVQASGVRNLTPDVSLALGAPLST